METDIPEKILDANVGMVRDLVNSPGLRDTIEKLEIDPSQVTRNT